jgi:2-succinyl-6-hydroxy-2,4-cyclohexadiene-1-carboxylate synthase
MMIGWPYRTGGLKSHPAVVFLHGFLGDGRDWEVLEGRFAEDFYCIFPDLPGHGENRQQLPVERLTFRWLEQGLKRLLLELNLPAAHLVGYSMGGRAALYAALYYPRLVKSLTLESASPGLANRRARQARRLLDEQRAMTICEKGLECFLDEWYQMPLFASLQRNPALIDSLRRRRNLNDPQAVARVIAELSPGRQPSLWGKLQKIQVPVLLMAGALDDQYTLIMNQMISRIADARLQIAPGAGHNIHLESPEWYVPSVQTFLSSL